MGENDTNCLSSGHTISATSRNTCNGNDFVMKIKQNRTLYPGNVMILSIGYLPLTENPDVCQVLFQIPEGEEIEFFFQENLNSRSSYQEETHVIRIYSFCAWLILTISTCIYGSFAIMHISWKNSCIMIKYMPIRKISCYVKFMMAD